MKLNQIAGRKFQRRAMEIPLSAEHGSQVSVLWRSDGCRRYGWDAFVNERSIPLEGQNRLGFLFALATRLRITHTTLMQAGTVGGTTTRRVYVSRTATCQADVQAKRSKTQKRQRYYSLSLSLHNSVLKYNNAKLQVKRRASWRSVQSSALGCEDKLKLAKDT
jgi:hypothetical protein